MNIDQRWIYAGTAVIAGFVIGAILAAVARRLLGNPKRRAAIRTIAPPTATFLFWVAAVTGVVTAVGFTSPDTLEPIPSDVLSWLPKALVAGLIVLAGYAAGGAISVAVAAAVQRAIGHRPAGIERVLRWGIIAAAVVLALGNLGVQTTSLQIIVAGIVFSVGLAFALLAGLGGRDIASAVATGRTLRPELTIGTTIQQGDLEGEIIALRPAYLVVQTPDAQRTIVPYTRLFEHTFATQPSEATN